MLSITNIPIGWVHTRDCVAMATARFHGYLHQGNSSVEDGYAYSPTAPRAECTQAGNLDDESAQPVA